MKVNRPLPLIAPFLLWMAVFFVVPMGLVLFVSLMSKGLYGGIDYTFTMESYIRFLDPLYLRILGKSLLISCLVTFLCLLFGYPFAYMVARSPNKYRNLLLFLIIIPFWMNSLIRTYAWIILLRTEGAINLLLQQIGWVNQPLALLYHDGAVIIGLVYTLFPFMVLPLFASIEKLDRNYLEAASDLGASPWRTFWNITLPLTLPGIVAGSLLVFIPSLGLFFIPDLMGGGKAMFIGNLIKNQFLAARDWPFGAAASVILIGITFLLIRFYKKVTKNYADSEVL